MIDYNNLKLYCYNVTFSSVGFLTIQEVPVLIKPQVLLRQREIDRGTEAIAQMVTRLHKLHRLDSEWSLMTMI